MNHVIVKAEILKSTILGVRQPAGDPGKIYMKSKTRKTFPMVRNITM
jgi:hypothetical protein